MKLKWLGVQVFAENLKSRLNEIKSKILKLLMLAL